jgi:hypothetical protein
MLTLMKSQAKVSVLILDVQKNLSCEILFVAYDSGVHSRILVVHCKKTKWIFFG